jgi:hypothetical protein
VIDTQAMDLAGVAPAIKDEFGGWKPMIRTGACDFHPCAHLLPEVNEACE